MVRDATLSRAIAPNRRIVITFGGQDYTTRVEATDPDEFTVAAPLDERGEVPIRAGDRVEVRSDNEAGQIWFEAYVRGRCAEKVPVIALAWPRSYERQQRREYVRVPIRMPVLLIFPAAEGRPEIRCEARTRDLGGGGLQAQWLHPDTISDLMGRRLIIEIELPDGGEPVRAVGTVVRAREAGTETSPIAELGIEFVQVSERDRNRICRHIYNRQIELRKRGLL
ncbi:MAG TPA: PilZ domain-containing protein [Armatimonadota bacterium]|nr:PilZ domain-containing protein [Armatimonadota bacterium]